MPVVVLLTIGLLAPAAWGATTNPSTAPAGVHRHAPAPKAKAAPPKSKTAARTAKTSAPRQTVRKAQASTASTKAHAPARKAPVKRVVVTEVTLV
jgi:hypothetical protein